MKKINRKIKFRALWADTKKEITDFQNEYLLDAINDEIFLVSQYTTFDDVDGKEIYENDIVTDSYKRIMQVIWRNGKFEFKALTDTNFAYADMFQWFEWNDLMDVRVIGDAYRNPELLINCE